MPLVAATAEETQRIEEFAEQPKTLKEDLFLPGSSRKQACSFCSQWGDNSRCTTDHRQQRSAFYLLEMLHIHPARQRLLESTSVCQDELAKSSSTEKKNWRERRAFRSLMPARDEERREKARDRGNRRTSGRKRLRARKASCGRENGGEAFSR